ncbi:MAG: YccF domain-containing protein [Gammaproteobacteria bacterium]|nr:YccF domain-containing protein [Gammaproteobacteria bacterium]NNJ72348.1 YccF domain-containing protein [Enterobacterales bacterium]
MTLLGNIIWIVFGGFFVFLGYLVGGLALCVTIIGIPLGIQCFKLSLFGLLPFGSDTRMTGTGLSGCNLLLNIVWLIFGGIPLVINHIFWGLLLGITIIGIPFAKQHFKMVKLAFTPFGREIYELDN